MVGADLDYVRRLIADKVIVDPVLELGVAHGGLRAGRRSQPRGWRTSAQT